MSKVLSIFRNRSVKEGKAQIMWHTVIYNCVRIAEEQMCMQREESFCSFDKTAVKILIL